MKDCQIKSIIEIEQIAKFCRSSATLLSRHRVIFTRYERTYAAHLRNRRWFRSVPEAAGLKNVLAARQLLPEKNSARVCYVLHPGALRLMSLEGRHLRNHIRNTLLKRQFRAIHRLLQ